jgi:hypothetical protein
VVLSSFYSYSFKMIRFFLIFPNIGALKFKVKLLIMTVPYQSILMQNTFYNSASDVISFFVLGVTSFISFIFNKYSNDTCRLSAFFVDNYFHVFFFPHRHFLWCVSSSCSSQFLPTKCRRSEFNKELKD